MPRTKKEVQENQEADSASKAEAKADPVEPVATAEQPTEQPKESEPQTIQVMTVEGGTVYAHVYPQIRVGVCEFHGTPYGKVDLATLKGKCSHVCKTDPFCPHSKTGCPHEEGYTGKEPKRAIIERRPLEGGGFEEVVTGYEDYCRHEHNYKGLQLRCTYCPKDVNMRSVINGRTLYVYSLPDNPTQLIVVCSDYRCQVKHQARFNRSVV